MDTDLTPRVIECPLVTFVRADHEIPTDDELDQIRAKVFGELVKMAAPAVRFYHSDFYRDAQTLKTLTFPSLFAYSFDDCGTWLISEDFDKEIQGFSHHRDTTFDIEISLKRYTWTFTATERAK